MVKSKKQKDAIIETQPINDEHSESIVEQIIEETAEEQIIERPTTENAREYEIRRIKEENIDPKKQILIEYADFWNSNKLSRKAVVRMEVGRQIWDFWQIYTERKASFNGCGSCVPPKVKYLAKECEKYGIELQ